MIQDLEIGRVLRASTAGFAIGCRISQLSGPGFGSLVKAQPVDERESIYGLIYDMHIDDDPMVRRLVMVEAPRQSVIEDQRNNRLLPLEMSVLTVGYRTGKTIYHGLPPRPPLNLDPIYLCRDPEEVRDFSQESGYLRLILRSAVEKVPVDQLLAAHVRQIYHLRGDDVDWAKNTIHEIVSLLRSNYELLLPALEAISAALPDLDLEGWQFNR